MVGGADQRIGDARELAQDDAVVLAAIGHRDAEHLLHREREAYVVEHRRDVVAAIDVGGRLASTSRARTSSLEAAVEVADLNKPAFMIVSPDGSEDERRNVPHRGVRRARR